MSAERWLLMRDELKRVRSADRNIEMIVDRHLSGSRNIQFHFDLPLYGIYEAVLMAPSEAHDGLMRDLVEVFDKTNRPPIALPPAHPYPWLNPEARVVKPKMPRTMRPETIWQLQERFIREITLTAKTRDVIERTLPPHKSQAVIDEIARTDLYTAVCRAPYDYREQLCARLIKLHDIPMPPEPKPSARKHHIAPGHEKPSRDRILIIDKSGNAWTWNLGWGRVKENGDWLDPHKPRLGHVTFHRVIKQADPDDFRRTAFHYTRPWGQWRTTTTGPVAHELFGNGVLRITDGVHAVVDFNDGIKREVMLANLTAIGVSIPRKPDDKPERKPREKKSKPEMTLEDLLKMI